MGTTTALHIMDIGTTIEGILLAGPFPLLILKIQDFKKGFHQNQSLLLLHQGFPQNMGEVEFQDLEHQDFLEVNNI